eukprot:COSAG01_NODE_2069_length_8498_cov_5.965841_7_plen_45_part_00
MTMHIHVVSAVLSLEIVIVTAISYVKLVGSFFIDDVETHLRYIP